VDRAFGDLNTLMCIACLVFQSLRLAGAVQVSKSVVSGPASNGVTSGDRLHLCCQQFTVLVWQGGPYYRSCFGSGWSDFLQRKLQVFCHPTLPWPILMSQDGDLIMHEGGPDAPTVSKVAEKLAQQDLEKEDGESVADIIVRVQGRIDKERRKVAKKFARQARLAKEGKLGGGSGQGQKGADEVGNKGPGGVPVEADPALAVAVILKPGAEASNEPGADDMEEHVGDAVEKRSVSAGSVSMDKEAREAKAILTDPRQGLWLYGALLPVAGVLLESAQFLILITSLTFPSPERRGKLTWSKGWPLSTKSNLHGGTDDRNKPQAQPALEGYSEVLPLTAL
jgi:hypothetical protein